MAKVHTFTGTITNHTGPNFFEFDKASIVDAIFTGITSPTDGAAIYSTKKSVSFDFARSSFIQCSCVGHNGGGFYCICASLLISQTYGEDCIAANGQFFRAQAPNHTVTSICAVKCGMRQARTQHFSVDLDLGKQTIKDINVTLCSVTGHGSGLYSNFPTEMSTIYSTHFNCSAEKGVNVYLSGKESVHTTFQMANVVGCTSGGVRYAVLRVRVACDMSNCVFKGNTGNFMQAVGGLVTLQDCWANNYNITGSFKLANNCVSGQNTETIKIDHFNSYRLK